MRALEILAQVHASGRMTLDEFRALSAVAPRFVDMMCQGTKRSRGGLREMAEAGELTADVVQATMR